MCAGVGAESGEFALQQRADQFGELVRLFTDRSTSLDSGGGGDCMRANFYVWIMPPEVAQAAVAGSQFYADGG